MNALDLADKLQHASSQYGAPFGDLWDGGAMLRNLHTENMALRATEYALRDRVKELEQANEAFAKRQEWWNNRMVELEQQLAARVPEGFVVVPVEADDEMIDAGADASNAYRVDVMRTWDAMLASAPPSSQASVVQQDYETRAEIAEQRVVCLTEERDHFKELYLALKQAKPQPLSEEEVKEVWRSVKDTGRDMRDAITFARAIEAAHGIKE